MFRLTCDRPTLLCELGSGLAGRMARGRLAVARETYPAGRLPVDVTAQSGVIYQRSNDPVYGRQQGVGRTQP